MKQVESITLIGLLEIIKEFKAFKFQQSLLVFPITLLNGFSRIYQIVNLR